MKAWLGWLRHVVISIPKLRRCLLLIVGNERDAECDFYFFGKRGRGWRGIGVGGGG